MRTNSGAAPLSRTSPPAAEAWLAWERRYNHDRFSMALNGLTPAERLATLTAASSSLPALTVPPGPAPSLPSTMDRPPIACPEPHVQADCSHHLRPTPWGHFLTSHYTFARNLPVGLLLVQQIIGGAVAGEGLFD
jgi:hypothetical protein